MEAIVSNYIPYSYLFGASLGSGRVSIPVPASQLPYANFKHVSGAAAQSASVYSIEKLKILDTLIDRMRSARAGKAGASAGAEFDRNASEERLDELIQIYSKRLHDALAPGASPYARPTGVAPGMLVSLAA